MLASALFGSLFAGKGEVKAYEKMKIYGYDYLNIEGFQCDKKSDGTYEVLGYYGKEENIEIPDIKEAKKIRVSIDSMGGDSNQVKNLSIPADDRIELFYGGPEKYPGADHITVEEGNKKYMSEDDVLYSSDGKSIYAIGTEKKGKYEIPESVGSVKWPLYYTKLEEVIIGKNVKELWGRNYDDEGWEQCTFKPRLKNGGRIFPETLKKIRVKEGNTKFKVKSNILYSRDGKTIYGCGELKGSLTMPSTVRKCCQYAFSGKKITKAKLSDNIIMLPEGLFYGCRNLKEIKIGKKTGIIRYAALEKTKVKTLELPKNVNYIFINQSYAKTLKTLKTKNRNLHLGVESDRDVDYESLPISDSYAKKYMKKLGIRVVVVKK